MAEYYESDKHVKKNPSWIKKGLFLILTLFLTGRISEILLEYCILAQGFNKVKLTLEQDECILNLQHTKFKKEFYTSTFPLYT